MEETKVLVERTHKVQRGVVDSYRGDKYRVCKRENGVVYIEYVGSACQKHIVVVNARGGKKTFYPDSGVLV